MPRPKKGESADLPNEIKRIAWDEIAQKGIVELSLRSIARQLNITAPAIYNHFRRKEDLITALIIDAFTEFGNSQLDVIKDLPEDDYRSRMRAAGLAYREWAVANPQPYLLIFGTPVKGYEVPMDKIHPVASRSLTALLSILDGARQQGILADQSRTCASPQILEQLQNFGKEHWGYQPHVIYLAFIIWSRVHGLVMFELGKQFPACIQNPGEIYNCEINSMIKEYIV